MIYSVLREAWHTAVHDWTKTIQSSSIYLLQVIWWGWGSVPGDKKKFWLEHDCCSYGAYNLSEGKHTPKKPSSILSLLRLGSHTFFSKELINFPRRQKRDQANAEVIEGPGNCSRTLLSSAERTDTSELQGLMGGAGGRTPLAGGRGYTTPTPLGIFLGSTRIPPGCYLPILYLFQTPIPLSHFHWRRQWKKNFF